MQMQFHKGLLLFTLLGSFFLQTQAQLPYKCEAIQQLNFQVTPIVPPSVCSRILDYPVGIPIDDTQAEVELNLFALSTVNTALSDNCKIAVNKALCTQTYPKCNSPSNVQRLACKDICEPITSACHVGELAILKAANMEIDCDDQALWSTDTTTCNSGPTQPVVLEMILEPTCAEYSGQVCQGGVPGEVYIPAGFSQELLEMFMGYQQFTFAVTPQATGCDKLHQAWTCGNTFPLCERTVIPGFDPENALIVPKSHCRAFCDAYSQACEPFFQISPDLRYMFQPNCNDLSLSGQPLYPVSKSVLFLTDNGPLEVPCANWSSPDSPTVAGSAVSSVNAICTHPLVIPDEDASSAVNTILGGACAPSCPLVLFSEKEYRINDGVTIGGSVLSLITIILYLVSWFLFKSERKSPYFFYMTCCMLLLYLCILVGAIRSHAMHAETMAHSLCKNNVEEYGFEGFCGAQGVIFLFGTFAAVSWWLVEGFDIFRSLVLDIRLVEGSKTQQYWKIAYHIFAWVPVTCIIIFAMARNKIGGYTGGMGWCLLTNGRTAEQLNGGDSHIDYELHLLYYPMIAYTAFGIFIMLIVMVRIFLIARKVENQSKSCWDRYMGNAYLRIIAYFVVMMSLWIYLFTLKLYAQSKQGEIEENLGEHFTCLLFDQFTSGRDCTTIPRKVLPSRVTYGLYAYIAFCGFFIIIMHSAGYSILKAWMNIIYTGLKRCSPRVACDCCRRFTASYASHGNTPTHSPTPHDSAAANNSHSGSGSTKSTNSGSAGAKSTGSSNSNRKASLFKHNNRSSLHANSNRTSGNIELQTRSQVGLSTRVKSNSNVGSFVAPTREAGSRFLSTPFRGWDAGSLVSSGPTDFHGMQAYDEDGLAEAGEAGIKEGEDEWSDDDVDAGSEKAKKKTEPTAKTNPRFAMTEPESAVPTCSDMTTTNDVQSNYAASEPVSDGGISEQATTDISEPVVQPVQSVEPAEQKNTQTQDVDIAQNDDVDDVATKPQAMDSESNSKEDSENTVVFTVMPDEDDE